MRWLLRLLGFRKPTWAHDVSRIPDEDLLRRAVSNCRGRHYRKGVPHPRWVAVQDTFVLGSTFSQQLCQRFGLNPDDMVKR